MVDNAISARMQGNYRRRWMLAFAVCTLGALFFSSVMATVNVVTHYPKNVVTEPLFWQSIRFCCWALMSPLVFAAARRFRIDHLKRTKQLLIHLLCSFLFAMVTFAVQVPTFLLILWPDVPIRAGVRDGVSDTFPLSVFVYWVILVVYYTLDYHARYRAEKVRTATLHAELVEAQLRVLRIQLNPHFLFNTLHCVSSLMHEDVEAADNVLTRLADLLRMSLENLSRQEAPLKTEIDFLACYMEIQQTRLRSRLTFELDIDSSTLDAMVPSMLLQPIVENAVTYGAMPQLALCRVTVRARRSNRNGSGEGHLCLEVIDNGPGFPADASGVLKSGLGLANTQARLAQLYGSAEVMKLSRAPGGGAMVSIELPYHTSHTQYAGHVFSAAPALQYPQLAMKDSPVAG
ncbi:MAG: histidine kinase [Acidobacteriaceae bacterium]